jgi:hypothetical protein
MPRALRFCSLVAVGLHIPIQAVQVENLANPDQGSEVVEAIIHKQKEPKVDLHPYRAVARHLATRTWFVRQAVVIVRKGILGNW